MPHLQGRLGAYRPQGPAPTLTNLADEEWERIRTQHISPLYVSVHATEPQLRQLLLGSARQADMDLMGRLRQLQDWGIQFHAQIVLMPGLNDGAALDRSLTDLATLTPALQTVSIVPVGLTRYRAHLPHLKQVTPARVPALIKQIAPHQKAQARNTSARHFTHFGWGVTGSGFSEAGGSALSLSLPRALAK